MISIGIDLGCTNIKSAVVDREKGLLSSYSIPTNASGGPSAVLDRIAEAITNTAGDAAEKPIGAGIGSPGVISRDRTTVSHPPNLPGWEVINVNKEIKKRIALDAIVDNDANLMALGSSRYGASRDLDSLVMLTFGTGVGGGIIYHRELYRGMTGGAAELGDVIIDYDGPESNSTAKGGIEAYIGQHFLIRKDLAIHILADAGKMLGYAIVNYIHILDIRNIIVSGGVAKAGDWILESARKAALERLMPPFRDGFDIRYETLGNDAVLLGAGSLAFEFL